MHDAVTVSLHGAAVAPTAVVVGAGVAPVLIGREPSAHSIAGEPSDSQRHDATRCAPHRLLHCCTIEKRQSPGTTDSVVVTDPSLESVVDVVAVTLAVVETVAVVVVVDVVVAGCAGNVNA